MHNCLHEKEVCESRKNRQISIPLGGLWKTGTYDRIFKTGMGGITVAEYSEPHDHAYCHAHGIAHSHGHVHENQKAVLNRLSRALGHLEKVKRMVEEGQDCSQVLVQLAAVRSALDSTGKVILKDHLRHCIVDAVAAGDVEAIDTLCEAVDKFMK
jgi:DNA-binding FrmR family transcriptional regulator